MLLLIIGFLAGGMVAPATPQAGVSYADSTTSRVSFAGLEALCPAPDAGTQRVFRQIREAAVEERLAELPFGELVQRVAERLIGSTYAAGLLDESSEEVLVVSLTQFDCVLFVESVLALAHSIVLDDFAFASYARTVRDLRYRNGEIDGYCSRLHYFSDWIHENDLSGHIEGIYSTQALRYDKRINFMSANSSRYPKLNVDRAALRCVQEVENNMAHRRLYYIPQNRLRATYADLQAGDIVAITTSIGGLDVTHTGFVYVGERGQIGLIHASTTGSVRVNSDLASYVEGNRNQTGIIVARPLAPSQ